jgi:hypothetical protein
MFAVLESLVVGRVATALKREELDLRESRTIH